MSHRRRHPLATATSLAALAVVSCNQVPAEQLAAQAAAAGALVDQAVPAVAEVTAVTGPGGLRSPEMAAGTFLGKGAKLTAGQTVETPKGTLAEMSIGGARIRLNEDTAVVIPSEGGELTLGRGEMVALVDGRAGAPLSVRAGDDTVRVTGGEVQIVHAGATRNVAVVHGHATLTSAGRTVELGAGERVTAPLVAAEREPTPELSLRPLTDTGWSRAFEQAAEMADSVPRGVGSLTARVPGSQTEKQQKLRLTDQRVQVSITGRLAHTEIEQAFFNDRGAVLEGIYRFPLPGDSSISGLQLLVGNTWMQGEVVEKQRARQIFQQIVDATIPRDPALLEWERGNVFKLRIFPIPGRGERRVKLSYTQVLPVVGDSVRYRFPLGGTGATGTNIEHFAFSVAIDRSQVDGTRMDEIDTPMLALDRRDSGDRIEFHTDQTNFQPTYDLGLDIPVSGAEQRIHADTHLDRDGQAYFMLALHPELELAKDERPINFAFVLDRSHSTAPELWTVARGMVEAMAGGMDETDRFTVLACDTACDELPSGLQAPSAAAVEAAQRFLSDQDLAGASDVGAMLIEAGEALTRGGSDKARNVVVYLGDGAPSSGELAPDRLGRMVAEALPDAHIQAIALGSRSDLVALQSIVEATGGDLVQADARDDLRDLVRELRLRAEVPVARDLRIETPAGMVAVHHNQMSGIRAGDSVIVTGKLAHPVHGQVKLHATGPKGPIEAEFPIDITAARTATPDQNTHLPRTWAQMEIAELTRKDGFAAKDRIVELSKDYTVLSRFTALLVLENDAMYREFNVVRAAKDTDAWKGGFTAQLGGAPATGEAKPTEPAKPTTTPTMGDGDGERAEKDVSAASPVTELPPAPEPTTEPAPGHAADVRPSASGPAAPRGNAAPPAEPDAPAGDLDLREQRGDKGGKELEEVIGGLVDAEDEAPSTVTTKSDLGVSGTGEGGGGRGGFAVPPPAKAKKAPSAPRDIESPWADPLGFDDRKRSSRWHEIRPPRLRVAAAGAASGRSLAQIEALRRAVAIDPSRRSTHGQLVRSAMRVGHADALAFARAWADADPDHAPALLALADVLASDGDPLAERAYASALEVTPFSKTQHDALARAFASKGDLRRACSHRRALVSIDPRLADNHAALASCLHREGRTAEARAVLRDGATRAHGSLAALTRAEAELLTRAGSPAALRGGQLRATLTWSGEDDLDIAVIDAGGARLSATHPIKLRTREGAGLDEIALTTVKKSVFVEVTRNGTGETRRGPIHATLAIQTPHGGKTFPVVIDDGSVRIARVFWSR